MTDQASKLRALANNAPLGPAKKPADGPRIITVTSGKGGVGKTNFVVNLALALASMNQRVAILDADFGLANVEVLMGINPSNTLYELLYNDKTIEDIIVKGPKNIRFISGGSGLHELSNLDDKQRQHLINSLNYFQDRADFVLIDTGAGISKNVLAFIAAADEVIVIITPEPTSLTDGYSLIKVMSKFNIHPEVGLIVNMAANERDASQTISKINMVANKFLQIKINYLGTVYTDYAIVQAVKSQNPFMLAQPHSAASKSIIKIASNITSGQQQPVKGMGGFIGKVLKLFR